ncbi:MAG: TAXI family TRAP transporter solute-binding subunit [Hydrococcus sp. RU_2_2]|nr:TAXI family TRAP transporter solute-binding subunit [Hydrococcus sp. RU_2_2]NJP17618.1 TAXI family TRAP transporter solute-binding subunit [Hydrococcus sp. CRU_1_1]
MQNRLAFPIVVLSIVMAGIFGVQWYSSQNRTHYLTIATGAKGGQYYAFAQALAKVVSRHQPHIQIQVLETEGSQQNEKLLTEKKVQLALLQSDTPISPSIEVVGFLFPEMFHLIVTEKSEIKNVSDLKGKRIALMPKGSGSYRLFWRLSEHYGLKDSDFEAISLPPEQAYKALSEGKVDALFRVIAVGTSGVSQLLQNNSTKLIPIDQAAALQLSLPVLEESQIPKGTYNGAIPIPPEDLPVVAVRSVLATSKSVDEKLIYKITKTLYEARNELVEYNTQAAMIRQPDPSMKIGWSFHRGAKSYYDRDRPNFLVEYTDIIGLLFSIGVFLASGIWQLRTSLKNKEKNRCDFYSLEIVQLIEQIETSDDLEQLALIRRQLFTVFGKVVSDFDKDRISFESLQSFRFPWEVALNTLRHREKMLINERNSAERYKSSIQGR